jgi:hypothetical protein
LLLLTPVSGFAESGLKGFELQVFNHVSQCRDETVSRFELLLKSGKLSIGQLFDTFYIPIPNTYPQKYSTQYDKLLDTNMQGLLDSNLKRSSRYIYFIVTDVNGYVPTHNSKFSQVLSGNKEVDAKKNRTKIIFNDRTGLAAARNTAQYLLQEYPRDTGEMIYDMSVPIYVRGQHWGCVRVGYSK